MTTQEWGQPDEALLPLWESHKDDLRRLLISIARDIDLADDFLQETYLRARQGISGYRNGEARAWLAAIAKNVFYAYARRKYVSSEIPLDSEEFSDEVYTPNSPDQLVLIQLRSAIAGLSPVLRYSLLLKHYGGFTYEEIAECLGCPVGTAKSRVNAALKALRAALGEDEEEGASAMRCKELTDRKLLDLLYDRLTANEAAPIERHLGTCPSCRERVEDIRRTLHGLDALESEYKATCIIEIHRDGSHTDYLAVRFRNNTGEVLETLDGNGDFMDLNYVLAQGREAAFEPVPSEPGETMRRFKVNLPRPIAPDEVVDMLMVGNPISGADVQRLDDHKWRFGPGNLVFSDGIVFVVAVRLPEGAGFAKADPSPAEVRSNHVTTVVWRDTLKPDERFEFWIEYAL